MRSRERITLLTGIAGLGLVALGGVETTASTTGLTMASVSTTTIWTRST